MVDLIVKEFQNLKIVFTPNGEINATQTAKLFNKDIRQFMRSKSYKDYAKALAKHLNTDVQNLHTAKSGGDLSNNQQGTFLHPRLLVFFARWLSPDFAVWCDEYILNGLKYQIELKQKVIDRQQNYIDKQVEERDRGKFWMND